MYIKYIQNDLIMPVEPCTDMYMYVQVVYSN